MTATIITAWAVLGLVGCFIAWAAAEQREAHLSRGYYGKSPEMFLVSRVVFGLIVGVLSGPVTLTCGVIFYLWVSFAARRSEWGGP